MFRAYGLKPGWVGLVEGRIGDDCEPCCHLNLGSRPLLLEGPALIKCRTWRRWRSARSPPCTLRRPPGRLRGRPVLRRTLVKPLPDPHRPSTEEARAALVWLFE